MEICTESKKRVRDEFDDSLTEFPTSKLARVDSLESETAATCTNQNSNRDSSESEYTAVDFQAGDEIDDDLLNILEDSNAERDEAIPELQLDSFIRSFEEEIQAFPPAKMASDQNESQPELGFLFEASDDELGLPPSGGSNAEEKIEAIDDFATPSSSGIFKLDGNLGFEDELSYFDSFEIGIGTESGGVSGTDENELGGEFSVGGLFDYSDLPFRAESLPAL